MDEWINESFSNVRLEKKQQMYISNNDFTVINPPSSFHTPQQIHAVGAAIRARRKRSTRKCQNDSIAVCRSSSKNKNCLMPHEFEGRY